MSAVSSVSFADAIHIVPIDSHTYRSDIPADYSIGHAAHGGFMAWLIIRTLAQHLSGPSKKYDQPDTSALHMEFLRPGIFGEVVLSVEDTRLGKGSSTVHITLIQEGKERVVGYASNFNADRASGLTLETGYKLTPPPSLANLSKILVNGDPCWIQGHVPYHPASPCNALSHVFTAYPTIGSPDPSINDTWLTPARPEERITTDMLGLMVDYYSPPPENFFPDSPHSTSAYVAKAREVWRNGAFKEIPGWGSPRGYMTTRLSLDIKQRLPPGGVKWLFVRHRVKCVLEGRLDDECTVLDEHGNLIALCNMIWIVEDMSRVERASKLNEVKGKL